MLSSFPLKVKQHGLFICREREHTLIANDVKDCMKFLNKLRFMSCADVFSIETGSLGWDMLKGSSHESSIFMVSFP